MRGLDFGFISCSLLSQVDASVGGKNGINFGKLKNMLGVFNPPQFVICDPELLKTLPKREVRSGFGEVIKHAIIKDKELFDFLLEERDNLLNLNPKYIADLMYRAVNIKTAVVEEDPTEKGERKKLNFGHTIGHAIENNSPLTHGEAISVGMVLACILSQQELGLNKETSQKIVNLLQAYQLPTHFDIDAETINLYLGKDKKKDKDAIHFILLEDIGNAVIQSIEIVKLNNLMPSILEKSKELNSAS